MISSRLNGKHGDEVGLVLPADVSAKRGQTLDKSRPDRKTGPPCPSQGSGKELVSQPQGRSPRPLLPRVLLRPNSRFVGTRPMLDSSVHRFAFTGLPFLAHQGTPPHSGLIRSGNIT